MTIIEPGADRANLVARVRNLLLQPSATWDEIDREPATVNGLMTGYVVPLALIPAVCTLIGLLVFGAGVGFGGFGMSVRFSPVYLITQAVLTYALSLGMVFVMAAIIDALAPSFGATKDRTQAFKLAAYAPTASWVAGVFLLLPALGIVALLGGIYSLVLLYKGLPKLMKAPEDRAVGYFAVVLVAAVVVSLVIAAVVGSVLAATGVSRMGAPAAVSGTLNIPGQGDVDLGKLAAAGKAVEAAAKQMESGEGPSPTDPDLLKAFLPAAIGGFTRTEVSASTGGVAGIEGSGAEGRYTRGDAQMTVEVLDLGAAGALAGMAGAFNMKSFKETATGYEKVGKVDGRLTMEEYDRTSRHGEYSVLVADRFMVQAKGDDVNMDDLKGAVNAVGIARLEGLAKGG